MKEFIEWAVERFGESAQALGQSRSALDKVLQRERNAGTPAQTFTNIMQVIGVKGREKAEKDFGSYYGVANGGLGILDFFFAVRGLGDWQKKLTAPSTKLTNAEEDLMAALVEGGDDLAIPADATIKTCALLKRVMSKIGLRGEEGIARAKMIISRASQVREQAEAFAKTQAAIATARKEAGYLKLLADGSYNEAVKALQKAGATEQEARDAAKEDLKQVFIKIEDDETLDVLIMMLPADVLPEAEANEWKAERTQALKGTAKNAGKPVEEKPVVKAKKPKAKKLAPNPASELTAVAEEKPAAVAELPAAPVESPAAAVVEEKSAVEVDLGAPEEFAAPKAEEDPAPTIPGPHKPACPASAVVTDHNDCDELVAIAKGTVTIRRWRNGASTDFSIEEKKWNKMQRKQAKAA